MSERPGSRIRALVVDDEVLARERIRTLLEGRSDVEVIAEAGGGHEAVELIEAHRPELVFLDIQMPDLDGFGVLDAVETELPAVVFVTAYDAYALRAFEVHALDYLLKPLDPERFTRTVDRAVAALAEHRGPQLASLLGELSHRAERPARLAVRADGRIVLIDPSRIDWIEADGKHAHLHLGREVVTVRRTLSHLADRLARSGLLRIHRSTIVNPARIKEVQPYFHGEYVVILQDGTKLTSSAAHSADLHRLLQDPL